MTNDPFGPTWFAATMAEAPERPALSHDVDVDLCVVGAGLAGLTVAREVARRGWSVAVLESRRVAWNASGRNAGMVSPGFAERIETIVERVGLARAKELWALSQEGVDYVRAACEGMAGIALQGGKLAVRRVDDEDETIRHVAMLNVDFGEHAEVWPTAQVREVLRTPRYYQAIHSPTAFQIHPLNYALGLAADAEAAGARIFEGTTALSLDPAGVRKRVDCGKARVRASHVVLAGNVHLGGLEPVLAGTVLPMASFMAVTQPLGERLDEAIRFGGGVADTRRAGHYYRRLPGDRLLWGVGLSARTAAPRWLKHLMRRDIRRLYPQLGEVEIEYAWAGTLGYAVHRMPQIGEIGPGYWLASAFGGHGINTSAMAGVMLARAILDGDDRWRLFAPYELVWAGGAAGRTVAQVVSWGTRLREAVREHIAHHRAAARERAATQAAARAAAEAAATQAAAQAQQEAETAAREAEDSAARWAAQAEEREVVAARAAEVEMRDAAPPESTTARLEAAMEEVRAEIAEISAGLDAPVAAEPSPPEAAVATHEAVAAPSDIEAPEAAPPAKPKRKGGRKRKTPPE